MMGLGIAYMFAEFDHYSFSRSRDMVGVLQNFNVLRDLTTPLSKNDLPSVDSHLLRSTYLPNLNLPTTKI